MKILIVGMGSIGLRHLNNILSLYPESEIIVLRHSKAVETEIIPGISRFFYSLSDAIEANPDVAFLTNPAPFHIPVALELAKHGIHIFIEKPLSHDLNGVYEFLKICKKNNIVVMIGYNLRYKKSLSILKDTINSGLIGRILSFRCEVGQYLPDWRIKTDYHHSVSARKELGGGVLLELSHEIDFARLLLGEFDTVCAISGKYSDLDIDVEDIAEITIQFRSGVVGNIHLDMVNQAKTRNCQIIGSKGTLFWDVLDNSLKLFSRGSSEWSYLIPPYIIDTNQTYLDEIQHFFDCIRESRVPAVSIMDGIAVLEIIHAIRESSSEKRCTKV